MEENFPWRLVFLGVFFSLLVLGFAYLLIAPPGGQVPPSEHQETLVEFHNSRIIGRKDGAKSWEFFAERGWTPKGSDVTFLYGVKKGSVTRNKKELLRNLTAPEVKFYPRNNIFEASAKEDAAGKKARITAAVAIEGVEKKSGRQKWNRIEADYLKFYPEEKRSELAGNVRIQLSTSTINTDKVSLFHEPKSARLEGKVRISRDKTSLQAERAEYLGEEDELILEGDVQIRLAEKKPVLARANQVRFPLDEKKEVLLTGNIEVTQGQKAAVGEKAVYLQQNKDFLISERARVILEKGSVLLKPETIQKLKNQEANQLLKEKTIVTAAEFLIATTSGDLIASGEVKAEQKGEEAISDRAIYKDTEETLQLTGNVFLKRKSEWLKCREVRLDIRHQSFEALGVEESRLKF